MTESASRVSRTPGDTVPQPVSHDPSGREFNTPVEALAKHAAAGVLWTTAQKWAIRVASIGTLAVLTRLVTPEEYGLVAAAGTFLPFFYLLSDAFTIFFVQAEQIDRRILSTGFWFSLGVGLLLMAVTIAAAPLVSALMGISGLAEVLRALSVSVLLSALAALPTAILRRELAFRALALQGLVAALVSQLVAITLAVAGFGAWALVSQLLVMQTVAAVLAWVSARWVPGLAVSMSALRSMAAFGTRVSAAEFLSATRSLVEAVLLTSTLGASAFGYYRIAQTLVWALQDLSASAVKPVSVVVFARIRNDPERLTAGYTRALSLAYTVVAPLMTALAVTAPILIPLLFGEGWGPSVLVAQVMSVAFILILGSMVDQGLLYGIGQPGVWLRYSIAVELTSIGVTAIAVHRGLTAVAIGLLVVASGATLTRWLIVSRILRCPVSIVVGPFIQMATTASVAAGLGLVVLNHTPSSWSLLVQAGMTSCVVAVSYLALVRLRQREMLEYALATTPVPHRLSRPVRRVLLLPTT